ncbi:MAG: NAD(P)/FAD-dependent oxidoreductase [Sorangiineae bacterium]|nr:NAD(P)/FAD-dependent oxidoreductase [Polyangiaceae bacterium]MEB2322705.1 NAD(P)/FAD-dependent oxidoreductase [Sorangiineae bacterium]
MRNDHVLIIGSGFAGIGLAIRLKQAGIEDFTILERAESLGGTWRDNTYPGVACDVPSHLYSFSFEPNPTWSRFFAPQSEILAYLERCADKYGVRPHIRFGVAAEGASFDEQTGLWTVKTSDGQSLEARVVVSGSGHALSRPIYPDLPGRDTFAGKSMHSARWDHDYALEGKTVAVVGTGASAIQIAPAIAPKVKQLFVFQRTPGWLLPKPDRAISPREQSVYRRYPALQKAFRAGIYSALESMAIGYVVEPRLNRIREEHALLYLRRKVKDPALRKKLTPSFRLGCKRILLSNDWYDTLQRPNVALVAEPITEVRAGSLVTRDGAEHHVDAIAWATGFEAAEARPPFAVQGRGGRDLATTWKDHAEAYLGTTISGFPNLFLIIGPNLGLGHSSMVLMMESQFAYVVDAIKTLRARKLDFVDVRPEVAARYNDALQARLAGTVWNSGGCSSWYLTRTGKNTTAWPGFTFEFRWKTRRFDVENYELGAQDVPTARERAVRAPSRLAALRGAREA